MANDELWIGHEVQTAQAKWICVTCKQCDIPSKVDGVEYSLQYEARNPHQATIPPVRSINLRTSEFRIATDPGFVGFLTLVIEGQLLETEPWDRSVEVYERD